MASNSNLDAYVVARSTINDRNFWSEMTIITGAIVSGLVILAGIIIEDSSIMISSGGVMLAFAFVSTGILLSTRKHHRLISQHYSY